MASKVVRDTFRGVMQVVFSPYQYVETIASRVDSNDLSQLWTSLEFIGGETRPICIGSPTLNREIGIVRVWTVGQAGSGDGSAIDLCDEVAAYFRGFTSGTIRATSVTSPQNGPESDGRWFLAYCDVTYQYDFTA